MATNTPNYNLVKPSDSDLPDQSVLNGNMDKIDAAIKANAANIGLLTATIVPGDLFAYAEKSLQAVEAIATVESTTNRPTNFGYASGIIFRRYTNPYIMLIDHTGRIATAVKNGSSPWTSWTVR